MTAVLALGPAGPHRVPAVGRHPARNRRAAAPGSGAPPHLPRKRCPGHRRTAGGDDGEPAGRLERARARPGRAVTPEGPVDLTPTATGGATGDLAAIPERDLPPGCPPWWRDLLGLGRPGRRIAREKRATIRVAVPRSGRPGRGCEPHALIACRSTVQRSPSKPIRTSPTRCGSPTTGWIASRKLRTFAAEGLLVNRMRGRPHRRGPGRGKWRTPSTGGACPRWRARRAAANRRPGRRTRPPEGRGRSARCSLRGGPPGRRAAAAARRAARDSSRPGGAKSTNPASPLTRIPWPSKVRRATKLSWLLGVIDWIGICARAARAR